MSATLNAAPGDRVSPARKIESSRSRARQGKIARLPYELRETLCARMRDGWSSPKLIKWLAEAAPTLGGVNAQNITNWRQGGYRDWLAQQSRLDDIRKRAEITRRELDAGGFSVLDKQIYELAESMSDSDPLLAARAIAALKNAVTGAERAKILLQRTHLAERQAALLRDKFELQTCELFLKWFKDERARQIADSSATNDEKIKALRAAYFADVDALERSGEVEMPK